MTDVDIVYNEINNIRINPSSTIPSLKTVQYTLVGFQKTSDLANFVEKFISNLETMKPLPELKLGEELNKLAEALLLEQENKRLNLRDISQANLSEFANEYITKFNKIEVLYEESNYGDKVLQKMLFNKDDVKRINHVKIFNPNLKRVGVAKRKVGKVGMFAIILVDDYSKIVRRAEGLATDEELDEYRELFNMFDSNLDGLIDPIEMKDLILSTDIFKRIPSIMKLVKIFEDPKYKRGVDFDSFVDGIIWYGDLQDDDAIRRIFDLYVDDLEKETISLHGMKRIVNELKVKKFQDQIYELFTFAINKEIDINFGEFKEYVLKNRKNFIPRV